LIGGRPKIYKILQITSCIVTNSWAVPSSVKGWVWLIGDNGQVLSSFMDILKICVPSLLNTTCVRAKLVSRTVAYMSKRQ
jgi:hypothetical protein